MITLITGQPGNGKTAFAVWNEIRGHIEKRIVYTIGIPKLKLPTIGLLPRELALWHETVAKINEDDQDEIPLLKNIDEGSLIVIDECQKYWKPTGTIVAPEIAALDTHRHHGIDFVLLTQYPMLVHKVARVFVSKHYHIRNTWKGRQLLEWPEYQENPACKSSIATAVVTKYVLPVKAFELYESATIHTKLTHKTPLAFYGFIAALILVPMLGYAAYTRVMAKTEKPKTAEIVAVASEQGLTKNNAVAASPVDLAEVIQPFENVNLVSNKYDWSKIGACVSSTTKCVCYGDSGEALVVPNDVCRSALNGWAGRVQQVYNPVEKSTPKPITEPPAEV